MPQTGSAFGGSIFTTGLRGPGMQVAQDAIPEAGEAANAEVNHRPCQFDRIGIFDAPLSSTVRCLSRGE